MRSVFAFVAALAFLDIGTAHAQDAMCDSIRRVTASAPTHFSDLLGPLVVIDGEPMPGLHEALVSLPGAERCTVFYYETGGLYNCKYTTVAGTERTLAESLIQQASLCFTPRPTVEPKPTSSGWQFQIAAANVSAGSAFREEVVFHVALQN